MTCSSHYTFGYSRYMNEIEYGKLIFQKLICNLINRRVATEHKLKSNVLFTIKGRARKDYFVFLKVVIFFFTYFHHLFRFFVSETVVKQVKENIRGFKDEPNEL